VVAGGAEPGRPLARLWSVHPGAIAHLAGGATRRCRAWYQKIPTPRPFERLEYDSQGKIDPFSKTNFFKEIVVASPVPRPAGLEAERGHVKQLLEGFPLESMSFVGTLAKDGKRIALVRVNGMLHQVGLGAYMGQNLGKVTRLDDNGLRLRELTLDGNGHWTERIVELKLQETSK